MKRYIWGFPGVGKSNIDLPIKAVDADCELFKFQNINESELHSQKLTRNAVRNEQYPQNYLEYIQSVNADIVLVNCHISLLEQLDKEQVLLVYPNSELIPEYLQRYQERGDNASYLSYMRDEAQGIVDCLDSSRFEKYIISGSNTYLNDLFQRSDFMMKLMTRAEITQQLQRAMDLKVIDAVVEDDKKILVCDLSFVNDNIPERRINNPSVWTEAILYGEYELDIDQLMSVCAKQEKFLQQEAEKLERRDGLSREELEDKIMQGIVNGALGIYYGQIAPYSHGYEVSYKSDTYQRSWHCYCNLFDVPKNIVKDIENASGCNSTTLNVSKLLDKIEQMEAQKITSFTPAKDTDFVRAKNPHTYPYRSSIATVKDVHAGKGLDGIVQGHYQGDWSSMTASNQNSLVRTLVCMKGFCLDCIDKLDIGPDGRRKVVDYLKRHGTDVSTPEKLNAWIRDNPQKCGKEENRAKYHFNEAQEVYANAYVDFLTLKEMLSKHKGTLEEFCDKYELDGEWSDGLFECYFGTICASVFQDKSGSLAINDNNIYVWDNKHECLVEDDVTLRYIKDTCAEIGFDVKELEARVKGKRSLDDKIATAEAKVEDRKETKHRDENMFTK
ncbi:MAG: hypothetical protein IJZ42_13285 [Lachnospiraceae bacterium]|nr:hypothetical protein [Lachnospiraceae bacterium]